MQESRHGPAQLFKSASPGLDDGLGDLGGALVVVVYSLWIRSNTGLEKEESSCKTQIRSGARRTSACTGDCYSFLHCIFLVRCHSAHLLQRGRLLWLMAFGNSSIADDQS